MSRENVANDHFVGGALRRSGPGPAERSRWYGRLVFDEDSRLKIWTSPLGRTYTKSIDPILE